MKIITTGSIVGTGEILVTITKSTKNEGNKNFPIKKYTTDTTGKTIEDIKDVTTREENYTGETTDTFRINLNDIKIELNQETNADVEGVDVIKTVWQILGNAISNIKEALTK